jgi:hypothetical protein
MESFSSLRTGIRKVYSTRRSAWIVVVGMTMLCGVCGLQAQVGPKTSPEPAPSVVDLYGGYGYIDPLGNLSKNGGVSYQSVYNLNVTASVSYYFWKNLGAQIEGAYFNGNSPVGAFGQCVNRACEDRDPMYYKAEGGLVYRFPHGRFIPYTHLLFGGVRVNGPVLQPLTWGQGATAGVGADFVLPFWDNHLALRAQADVDGMHVNFGPQNAARTTGGVGEIAALKLSGGVVLRMGSEVGPAQVLLACAITPDAVYPGETVTVTGTAANLTGKRLASYSYTASGGKVSRRGTSATIATAGLAPGSYTVTGQVEEGSKPIEMGGCTGSFTVKAYEPPTISCSANPSTVNPGDSTTIAAVGASAQNRALSYSYSASAGQMQPTGATATLGTAGLLPGPVQVTCNVVDDLGQTASTTTTVVVLAPAAAAAIPVGKNLCSIGFDRDIQRPTRVDNEGKACLDDLALNLQRGTDTRLDLIGNATTGGAEGQRLAAQRAVNTRAYLVEEKGLDAGRISVFTGSDQGNTVTSVLLPSGAVLATAATPVNEQAFPAETRKPLAARHRAVVKHKKKPGRVVASASAF